MRTSALRSTGFHQNRKDPIREIQRFQNLGHNLWENDKQTLHGLYLINYEIRLFILGIVITDGSLQVISIPKSAKRGHWTRAEQKCCIITD